MFIATLFGARTTRVCKLDFAMAVPPLRETLPLLRPRPFPPASIFGVFDSTSAAACSDVEAGGWLATQLVADLSAVKSAVESEYF